MMTASERVAVELLVLADDLERQGLVRDAEDARVLAHTVRRREHSTGVKILVGTYVG